jgi:hypothetical protein
MLATEFMEKRNWARYFEEIAGRDEIARDVIEGLFPFFKTKEGFVCQCSRLRI